MNQIALIVVEDVLAREGSLKTAFSHNYAKPLYAAIRSQFRTVALTQADQDIARWWLNREGMGDWSSVLSWNSSIMSFPDWCVDQVREFLTNAWEIAFLLTNDSKVAMRANELGVLTLSLGSPEHPPGWRSDDTTFTPWEELNERLAWGRT
jgi:hypothetical protein